MKMYVSMSILAMLMTACSHVPLGEETAQFAASTNTAITALKPLSSGYNQDARRYAFGKAYLDPNQIFGDDEKCSAPYKVDQPTSNNYPICFINPSITPEDMKSLNTALSAISGYVTILGALVDEKGLAAAKAKSAALKDSINPLEAGLQAANILGESDSYKVGLGALLQALVNMQDAQSRKAAIRVAVVDAGPQVKIISDAIQPIMTDLVRARSNIIRASWINFSNEYISRTEKGTHESEAERLALLAALQSLTEAQSNDPSDQVKKLFDAIAKAQVAFETDLDADRDEGSPELKSALEILEQTAKGFAGAAKTFGHPILVMK